MSYLRRIKNFLPAIELLLTTGPFLICWIIGILRYGADNIRFKLSVQNMAIFFIYILLLFINYTIFVIDVYDYRKYSYFAESAFSSIYIIINSILYFKAKNNNYFIFSFVSKILNKYLKAPIAQLDRASDYESGGLRFESSWARKN